MPDDFTDAPQEEKILMILRKSRKAFLIEYACGILLVGMAAVAQLKSIEIGTVLKWLMLLLGLAAIVVSEVSRQFLRYKISTDKVSIIKGILKQTKKNVYYLPLGYVPDINLKQSRIQRILNYGTVYVEGATAPIGERSFEIKDVNRPQLVLETIERLIDKSRQKR